MLGEDHLISRSYKFWLWVSHTVMHGPGLSNLLARVILNTKLMPVANLCLQAFNVAPGDACRPQMSTACSPSSTWWAPSMSRVFTQYIYDILNLVAQVMRLSIVWPTKVCWWWPSRLAAMLAERISKAVVSSSKLATSTPTRSAPIFLSHIAENKSPKQ